MQAAFAPDYIVTGVLGDPPIADKPLEEHLCHRCKLRCINTTWHKFWECEDNDHIDDPFKSKSNWLCKHARKGWDSHRCLWARAILPGDWIKVPDAPDYIGLEMWESPDFVEILNTSRAGFSDGAGGPKEIP